MLTPYKGYNDKAKWIIEQNKYMVIATCDKRGIPWASPVFYTYDSKFNFYFLSAIDSRHAENILKNPNVGVAIFDSTVPIGVSDGVQMEGQCSLVEKKDIEKVIRFYSDRVFPKSTMAPTTRYNPQDYSEPAEFRFFKIVVTKAYTTGVDRRVDINLKAEKEE